MSKLNLISLFWQSLKKSWLDLLLIIFFIFCLLLAFLLIAFFTYIALLYYGVVSFNIIFTYRLIWTIVTYLVTFIIAVIAQLLIINSLLKPRKKFIENLNSIKKYFWQFLILTIIINILFVIFNIPIYVSIFFFALDNLILGIISLIFGLIITILLTSYLIFSPFLLIDKNTSWFESIKKSFSLTEKKLFQVIFNVIILALIILILNTISVLVLQLDIIGLVLSTIIFIIMVFTAFIYLFAMYQKFK
ncbi:MAG: hypothetical protein GF365_01145|nr:hypothetical protein [Candidatus Buchananbacteria bacterium]